MKKIGIILVLFGLMGLNAIGQTTFQKEFLFPPYGGIGLFAHQNNDGGYIVGGEMSGAFLAKLNKFGDTIWTKIITNDTFGFNASSFNITKDGGFIITGYLLTGTGTEMVIAKTDSNGTVLWGKAMMYSDYGGTGTSVSETNDAGFIFSGPFYTHMNDHFSFATKLDSMGNELWFHEYASAGWTDGSFNSFQSTNDGGFIFAGDYPGSYQSNNYIQCPYLVKTDSNGTSLWAKNYIDSVSMSMGVMTTGKSVCKTYANGFVIAAQTSQLTRQTTSIITTDSIGNILITKSFQNSGNFNEPNSIIQTHDGGYMISGYTNTYNNGPLKFYLIKIDVNFNVQWSKIYGETSNQQAYSIEQTNDDGYIIAGKGNSMCLIKTDSNGNTFCNDSSIITTTSNPVFLISTESFYNNYSTTTGTYTLKESSGCIDSLICLNTGINEISKPNSSLSLYPNPTTSLLTLSLPNTNEKATINIYDMLGDKVLDEFIIHNSEFIINLESLSQGIYFLEVITNGEKQVRKVIKL